MITRVLTFIFLSVLDMACNDGHAEPQDAALKTLRLFCRNPRCRKVLVSLGIQQRLVRFLERSRMSGACSQQSSISSVPSTARTNDSVVSEHCVRILNKLKTRGNETTESLAEKARKTHRTKYDNWPRRKLDRVEMDTLYNNWHRSKAEQCTRC